MNPASHKHLPQLRVLHVSMTGTDRGGGVRRHIESLARCQLSLDIHVCALTIENAGGMKKILGELNIPLYELNSKGGIDPKLLFNFAQLLKKSKPTLIHFHSIRLMPMIAAALRRIPTILTLHVLPEKQVEKRFLMTHVFTGRFVNGVIAVSDYTKQEMTRFRIYPNALWATIPNGYDTRMFFPEDQPKRWGADSPFILVIVARLTPIKKISDALKALAILLSHGEKVELCIVGSGPILAELKQEAEELKIAVAVRFCGHHENPAPILRKCHAFIMVSNNETFGLAPLEAAACGVPVICYPECGGIHAWLSNMHGGIVSQERTPKSLANSILRLMKDCNLWNELRRTAIIVSSKFSDQECARKTLGFYQQVLSLHDKPNARIRP